MANDIKYLQLIGVQFGDLTETNEKLDRILSKIDNKNLVELTVTKNGVYTPDTTVDGFSKVTVSVPGEYISFVNASTGQSRTISGVAISDDVISFVSVSHEVTAAKSN